AGFKAHTQEWCAVVAADMPFVRAELLTALLQAGATADADAALPEFGGRLHPLFAVYRRSEALRTLTKFRAQGGRKVLDWLAGMRVTVLPEADVRRIDPEGLSLFNMNTPEDYDWVRARLGDRGV